MNWEAIGAVGQVLGSAAVLVTLGYLAVQIRQSRIAQNAVSVESVNQGFNAINALMSADEALTRIILKGNYDIDSLDPVERYRYFVTMQSYANQYNKMFSLYKVGALAKEDWELHLDALVAGQMSKLRGLVTLPDDLWQAIDAYGPVRHFARHYSVVGAKLE